MLAQRRPQEEEPKDEVAQEEEPAAPRITPVEGDVDMPLEETAPIEGQPEAKRQRLDELRNRDDEGCRIGERSGLTRETVVEGRRIGASPSTMRECPGVNEVDHLVGERLADTPPPIAGARLAEAPPPIVGERLADTPPSIVPDGSAEFSHRSVKEVEERIR